MFNGSANSGTKVLSKPISSRLLSTQISGNSRNLLSLDGYSGLCSVLCAVVDSNESLFLATIVALSPWADRIRHRGVGRLGSTNSLLAVSREQAMVALASNYVHCTHKLFRRWDCSQPNHSAMARSPNPGRDFNVDFFFSCMCRLFARSVVAASLRVSVEANHRNE